MEDHSPDNCSHQTSANEESISVLKSSRRLEFEDKVIVDPRELPHEKVASIHEQMQAQQC